MGPPAHTLFFCPCSGFFSNSRRRPPPLLQPGCRLTGRGRVEKLSAAGQYGSRPTTPRGRRHRPCSGAGSQSSVADEPEAAEWAMQDFYALRKDVDLAVERVNEIRQSAGLEQLEEEIASLESKSTDSSLWDDPSSAQGILVSLTEAKERVKLLNDFKSQVEEAETIVKLTEELDSIDTGLLQEDSNIIKTLNKALDNFEMTQLLSGPYDKEGAVINISAGAGGTDAQDWADMLLRMYVRMYESS